MITKATGTVQMRLKRYLALLFLPMWQSNPVYMASLGIVIASIPLELAQAEGVELNIKSLLKRDFGVDLNISGGMGKSLADPIVVLDKDPSRTRSTQMGVLRGLGKGRGVLWRTLSRSFVSSEGSLVEQVKIETKNVTADQVITQTENYYFDVTASEGIIDAPTKVDVRFPVKEFSFAYEVGWLHYDGFIDNEIENPGVGISIAYGAPGIKGTIFIYDNNRTDIGTSLQGSLVISEFEASRRQILNSYPDVKMWGEAGRNNSLHLQAFNVGDQMSLIGVGVHQQSFLKFRATYVNDPILLDVIKDTVSSLDLLLK
ncbi:MAG: hypothetical protein WCK42_09750 [Myxococcaceae bacterium]